MGAIIIILHRKQIISWRISSENMTKSTGHVWSKNLQLPKKEIQNAGRNLFMSERGLFQMMTKKLEEDVNKTLPYFA